MPGPLADTENRLGPSFCGAYYRRTGKRGSVQNVNHVPAIVTTAMVSLKCLFHTIRQALLCSYSLFGHCPLRKYPRRRKLGLRYKKA